MSWDENDENHDKAKDETGNARRNHWAEQAEMLTFLLLKSCQVQEDMAD